MPPKLLAVLLAAPIKPKQLTRRKREVLYLASIGLRYEAMASFLGVSRETVKWHVSQLLRQLGATTVTEAVAIAIRAGEIY